VKAYDEFGTVVYVDMSGFVLEVAIPKTDLDASYRASLATSIPTSMRRPANPVMILCDGEACAIQHNDDGSITESFYVFKQGDLPAPVNAYEKSIPIAYPIITMDNIINPSRRDQAMERVKIEYEGILEDIFKKTATDLDKTITKLEDLLYLATCFRNNRQKAYDGIMKDRNTIYGFIRDNRKNKDLPGVANKIASLACNMKERNDAYVTYINLSHSFTRKTNIMSELFDILKDLNNNLVETHEDVFAKNRAACRI
jgi:hypothetical protein